MSIGGSEGASMGLAPLVIHSMTRYSPVGMGRQHSVQLLPTTSSAWPAAGLAMLIPVTIPVPYLIRRFFWTNGATAAGNVDAGLYTESGQRVVSTGAVAQAGVSAPQYATLATPTLVSEGDYLLALSASLATATFVCATTLTAQFGRSMGLREVASGGNPLPATLAHVAWARTLYPVVGFTRLTSP